MAGTKHSIIANVPTWVTPGGTYVAVISGSYVQPSLFDAKGDMLVATANDTPARLPVGADGEVLTADSSATEGVSWQAGGGGGAPTNADYLVGTANGSLSNEIVVGTSPGGELGGTWASPTVDASHSGSTHAATQAAAESTAATALSGHAADTTSIHGIADTALLALSSQLPQLVVKAANESVTSSTVYQDDNHLTFSVDASSTYLLKLVVLYDADLTGDIKVQFSMPAGAAFSGSIIGIGNAAIAASDLFNLAYAGTTFALGALGAGTFLAVTIEGFVTVAGTSGSVTLQWAQRVSSPTASTVYANSFLTHQKVA